MSRMLSHGTLRIGEVDSGFQTLGALEDLGSASGDPAKVAMIADCGELLPEDATR